MILAAACFFRSSESLYNWIIKNKIFGQYVKNYRLGLGMPKQSKKMAYIFMWVFILFSIGFGIPKYLLLVKMVILIFGIIGTLYIKRLPNLD